MKITSTTKTFYDFIEMCSEIDRVLGYDQRECGKHFHPNSGGMLEWHESKGHDISSGNKEYNIKIGEMYKEAIKSGAWEETPYMDFWHWQVDQCVNDNFHNDSYGWVNISIECAEDAEDWQKEIQKVWYETFKDITDEYGRIDIWICW